MNENAIISEGAAVEDNRKYSLAGWFAVVQTVLFPMGIFMGIMQTIVSDKVFGYTGPMVGPSDMIYDGIYCAGHL